MTDKLVVSLEQLMPTVGEWYMVLQQDCKSIITEALFASNWAKVEGFHELGKRICQEKQLDREAVYAKKILSGLSKSIGVGERTLYRAIQFYTKFPDLSMLPAGKNVTWNKVITEHLPKHDDKVPCEHPEKELIPYYKCGICHAWIHG